MKKYLLLISMLTIVGISIVNAQSELIITENFQGWEPTEDTVDSICSAGVVVEDNLTRTMLLTTKNGVKEIPVTLIKCGIAPECESRRIESSGGENFEGVTKGWVLLNKLSVGKVDNFEESSDTIGEFIFGPIPQIDSIRIAHSATGGNRGFRIYTSFDGIEWKRPTDKEFWDGKDSQKGDVNSIVINESKIYIKITSGFKRSDSTSQFTRLHNIDVWGTPGVLVSVENKIEQEKVCIYPVPAKDIIYVDLAKNFKKSKLQIIDLTGKTVLRTDINRQSSSIDISKLRKGTYLVQITNNEDKIIKHLIVR